LNAAVLAWLAGVTIIVLSIASIDHSSSSTGWPTGVSYFFGSLRHRGTAASNGWPIGDIVGVLEAWESAN
jgi:hypothetical protein